MIPGPSTVFLVVKFLKKVKFFKKIFPQEWNSVIVRFSVFMLSPEFQIPQEINLQHNWCNISKHFLKSKVCVHANQDQNDCLSKDEWHIERQRAVQQVTTSDTTNSNEWHQVVQKVATNNEGWPRMILVELNLKVRCDPQKCKKITYTKFMG